jgi:cytochrome b561
MASFEVTNLQCLRLVARLQQSERSISKVKHPDINEGNNAVHQSLTCHSLVLSLFGFANEWSSPRRWDARTKT